MQLSGPIDDFIAQLEREKAREREARKKVAREENHYTIMPVEPNKPPQLLDPDAPAYSGPSVEPVKVPEVRKREPSIQIETVAQQPPRFLRRPDDNGQAQITTADNRAFWWLAIGLGLFALMSMR